MIVYCCYYYYYHCYYYHYYYYYYYYYYCIVYTEILSQPLGFDVNLPRPSRPSRPSPRLFCFMAVALSYMKRSITKALGLGGLGGLGCRWSSAGMERKKKRSEKVNHCGLVASSVRTYPQMAFHWGN